MVIRVGQFNLKLLPLMAVVALGLAGCQFGKSNPERQTATLRVHPETNPQLYSRSEQVFVVRAAPIAITIDKYPFLTEAQIQSAQIVESPTGPALSVKFNDQGSHLLEQYSAANAFRRFAIRSQFRIGTNAFDRWLAAPVIPGRIASGTLTFTPDANTEECEVIVRGWNNVAGYKPKPQFSEVP